MKPIQKLSDLAESLVPEHFIQNAPQFYGLIKAFLDNIQDVQTSIDSNFLDTIDYNKIKNSGYKKIYLDTFLATFNLSSAVNYESLGDMIKVSKHLSESKGTSLLFNILIKMLIFIMPSVGNTYNDLLIQYNLSTDEIEKAIIEKQLEDLKYNYQNNVTVNYEEFYDTSGNLIPFEYKLSADITREVYDQYIRPFAHPSGWLDTFVIVYINNMIDSISPKDGFYLYDMFIFPTIDASGLWAPSLTDPTYPTSVFSRAYLGLEADYATIISKIANIGNVVIDAGKVYYTWNNMLNPPTIVGDTTVGSVDAVLETPSSENFELTYGGFGADTTTVGNANGCLFANGGYLGYQIIAKEI